MLEARQQGGANVWCHNVFGFEDIPNWLEGLLDAQNIFDGGSHGSYKDSFYHYLNLGLHVPFSTGTDWFMYDFSRVYVNMPGRLSPRSWLVALSAGRSYITNGTFLEFTVDSRIPGDVLSFAGPTRVPVYAKALGRNDFTRLELIYNGKVIRQASSVHVQDYYQAVLDTELLIEKPGWLATRISDGKRNELGAELFAHTSPIYVEMAGERIFAPETAHHLITEMEQAIETIPTKAVFQDPTQWDKIRSIYEQGIQLLQKRLAGNR
jgi:hypothetical protein